MNVFLKTLGNIRDIPTFVILSFFLLSILACGNSRDTNSLPTTQTGTVRFYITDNVSDYKQVIVDINKVSLVNSGTQNICTVLNSPINLDIPKLADVLQLVDTAECSATSYNRVHLELKPGVQLMDSSGAIAACTLGSYVDNGGRVNRLQCDPAKEICTLDISGAARRGAIDILPDQANKVGLDFDLKNFSVSNFGQANCSVTMKVRPLQASDIISARRPETISGQITDLDTAAMTFRLKKGSGKFVFSYATAAGIKPELGLVLQTAQDGFLKVWIRAADLGSDKEMIPADDVLVMLSGRISNPDLSGKTFDLTYKGTNTVSVSYASADAVEGIPSNGIRVETKLYGYADPVYLAKSIKIRADGLDIDN